MCLPVVHPLDYVIRKLLVSIILTEWQADGLATLELQLFLEGRTVLNVIVLVQSLQD